MANDLLTAEAAGSFIDGEWRSGGELRSSYNPAHPAEEVVRYGASTLADVDDAYRSARRALSGWSATSAIERGQVLRRAARLVEERKDEFARLINADQGKTVNEAHGEVARTIETLYYHSAQARADVGQLFASSSPSERIQVVRRPVGIVGVVTPFNFPLVIPSWKIAPALVHGNTVVWKPASLAPGAAIALANVLAEAGLPRGVLNLVQGDGDIGAAVTDHPLANAITFTGSVPVGRAIARKTVERGVAAQMELGGHNVAIVLADTDLARAAKRCIAGGMLGAGQKCTSTRRVIVLDAVYEEFVSLLHTELRALRVGDGAVEDVDLGPLISAPARDAVAAAVDRAVAAGASPLVGASFIGDVSEGFYYPPTLLTNVTPTMEIAQQEVFGPVTSVLRARDLDEAIEIANGTEFGLVASVFTEDEKNVIRCTKDLDVGVLRVNSPTTGAEPHVPFTGRKNSSSAGAPPEQGETARDFFTVTTTVYSEQL